jgi:hypothetical protein
VQTQARSLQIELRLDGPAGAVAGSWRVSGGDRAGSFWGWLELIAIVERLRDAPQPGQRPDE